MKNFFSIIVLCFFLFVGCTANEPNRAKGEFVRHKYYRPIETNKDKVVDEVIYRTIDFTLHKVTINDTIISYIACDNETGFVKLN